MENKKNYVPVYEAIEWDDAWLHVREHQAPIRIMYVGDSISRGTRQVANGLFGSEVVFDNFATSKALDNPYYFEAMNLFAKQELYRTAFAFNNGLHGWHLSEEEYGEFYADFRDKLIAEYGKEILYIVTTTYTTALQHPNDRVIARNAIARNLAKERGLKIIDLYPVAEANKEHLIDGVHFDNAGYEALAREIVRCIRES